MSNATIGEIRPFAFDYAPEGWLDCDGRQLPASQYQALYSVIGQTYGGNGSSMFQVPDLRGRVAAGASSIGGAPIALGSAGGSPEVALDVAEVPSHSHAFSCCDEAYATGSTAFSNVPSNKAYAVGLLDHKSGQPTPINAYSGTGTSTVALNGAAIAPFPDQGGGAAHENRQPFVTVRFCICYDGMYPSYSS